AARIFLPIEPLDSSGRSTVMVIIVPELYSQSLRQLDWNGLEIRQMIQEMYSRSGLESPWFLVGSSVQTQFLRRQVQLAVKQEFPVTITGGEGALHEQLAIYIHRARSLSNGVAPINPPITIDCKLMDYSLLSGMLELISERSVTTAKGLGVILKDLDKLPLDLAQPLSSFLAKSESMDLYATAESGANSRTAPSRTPIQEELWNRVASFQLNIPVLSDRKEDLKELVHAWFVRTQRELTTELRDDSKRIATEFRATPEFYDALAAYPWKGDLSELANAMAHAFREANLEPLRAAHLPISLRTSHSELEEVTQFSAIDLDKVLEDTEKHLVLGALEYVKGNRSAAAKLLNVSRARLIRRLQQWGLDRETPDVPDDDLPKFEELD
ncbi:MAG: helix-turn-helix domain-containing protein, partial [Pirellula sp.]